MLKPMFTSQLSFTPEFAINSSEKRLAVHYVTLYCTEFLKKGRDFILTYHVYRKNKNEKINLYTRHKPTSVVTTRCLS